MRNMSSAPINSPCQVDMDVDASPQLNGTLKRCSSAPMINESNAIMTSAPAPSSRNEQSYNLFGGGCQGPRTRRFSASFSPVPGSPISGLRLAPRINQLRQEETSDRELAHEREIHHSMQISLSCEDLSLMNESQERAAHKMAPLSVALPPYSAHHCNSPSPTRLHSPNLGFQSPTRATRTFIRRSASPVLRPSPLGSYKRKHDDEGINNLRNKRFQSYSAASSGLLTTSHATQGSLSSVGTPESCSSADSPGFFRAVDSPSPGRAMCAAKGDQEMKEEGPS